MWRSAADLDEMRHHANDTRRWNRIAELDPQPLAVAFIDDIECSEGLAVVPTGALHPDVDRIDGTFQNQHPNPAHPESLESLENTVHGLRETDCEIGLAFDGDGDRLGVVRNAASSSGRTASCCPVRRTCSRTDLAGRSTPTASTRGTSRRGQGRTARSR
jgi:hypothetical protein